MGDLALSIAASVSTRSRRRWDTISENLTNANTSGCISESAELTAELGGDLFGVGDGVRVVGVRQNGDALLTTNAQQSQGILAQSTALQQIL